MLVMNCSLTCLDFAQDKHSEGNFLGGFTIDLDEVPTQESSESQVAPQWYKLQSKTRKGRVGGTCNSEM
jgi:hypothetical protein